MVRPFTKAVLALGLLFALAGLPSIHAQDAPKDAPASHEEAAPKDRIEAADLASSLQKGATPLILQVGPRTFFDQAHIVSAEYAGAASTDAGLVTLRDKVKAVEKDRWIVVYCGCCPWDKCPNIRPALHELQALGFTHVQALYLPNSFGTDWVDKGLPTEK